MLDLNLITNKKDPYHILFFSTLDFVQLARLYIYMYGVCVCVVVKRLRRMTCVLRSSITERLRELQ